MLGHGVRHDGQRADALAEKLFDDLAERGQAVVADGVLVDDVAQEKLERLDELPRAVIHSVSLGSGFTIAERSSVQWSSGESATSVGE